MLTCWCFLWGRLADRIGNRPLMITVGILVALTPLLWLEARTTAIFLWVWFPLLHIERRCDLGGDRPVQWQSDDLDDTATQSVDLFCYCGGGSSEHSGNRNHLWWLCRDCDWFWWLANGVWSLSRPAAVCPAALGVCSPAAFCASGSVNASPDPRQAANARSLKQRNKNKFALECPYSMQGLCVSPVDFTVP